jgi:hypothetical protein
MERDLFSPLIIDNSDLSINTLALILLWKKTALPL